MPEGEGAAPATAPAHRRPTSVDPLCSHVSPTQLNLRSPNRQADASAPSSPAGGRFTAAC